MKAYWVDPANLITSETPAKDGWVMVYTGAHGRAWNSITKEEGLAFCTEFNDKPFSLLIAVEKRLKEKNL
jgi:hypothetical protein